MLKINIELIKHENANATTRPIGFQIFENLRKLENFKIFSKILFFSRISLFFDETLYESSVRKPA